MVIILQIKFEIVPNKLLEESKFLYQKYYSFKYMDQQIKQYTYEKLRCKQQSKKSITFLQNFIEMDEFMQQKKNLQTKLAQKLSSSLSRVESDQGDNLLQEQKEDQPNQGLNR